MKKVIFSLLMAFAIPSFAQFKYSAWDIGPQLGTFKITNGMARYAMNGPSQNDVYLADSANSRYSVTNLRFNIEAVRTNFFVKAGASFPLGKHSEHDSESVVGKHFEYTLKFGYGFSIKEKVGFQFGLNGGIYSVRQFANPTVNATQTKFDYFVPSAGTTPLDGQHMFGAMSAWEGGLLISNVIAFSDQMGLQTIYSHNNLVNKKKTINGRNDQLEFTFYYSNSEWHNLGINVSFVQNWMHFKGYTLEDSAKASNFNRIYPATKVSMTTVYIGINFPIAFGD